MRRLYAGQPPWPDWISARVVSYYKQVYTIVNGTVTSDSISEKRKSGGSIEAAALDVDATLSITEADERPNAVNEGNGTVNYAELAHVDIEVGADVNDLSSS